MSTALEVLNKYWGHPAFRDMQADIVDSVLQGNDTLALLPTGGGKSVCFQVPALCMEGICIVISPLIALMKDQVQNLKKRGISAEAVYSGMKIQDLDRVFDNCVNGGIKFLYMSPERLGTELAIERIQRMKVNLIAIDEAHCISQWGYDFRPSYLNIAKIRELLPKIPVIALTATATSEVVQDIQDKLEFRPNAQVFKKSFARPNLAYIVLNQEDKKSKMLDILQKVPGTAVVYVMNRKETRDIAAFLQLNGISAGHYHAGLPAEKRAEMQDAWINDKLRVIVATNAFGMGIDKPDVRVVIHLTLPESLEAYFQEAGRGGRDGKKAYGVLLYNQSDRERLERNFEISYPTFSEAKKVYRALGSYFQLALGGGEMQSYPFDILDFAKKYNLNPPEVLPCLKLLNQAGYIEFSDAVFTPSSVRFLVDNTRLYDYYLRNPKMEQLLKFILRSYQGAFNHDVNIREDQLSKALNLPLKAVVEMLLKLHQEKILHYKAQSELPLITYLLERQDADQLLFDKARYDFLKNRAEIRMQESLHYAESIECRSRLLLAYFDEKNVKSCGVCDVCLGRYQDPNEQERKQISDHIRKALEKEPMNLQNLVKTFPSNMENKVLKILDYLCDNEFIIRRKDQTMIWNTKPNV
jgi:ATP-dependent DNA helicase RecQ